MHAVSLLLMKKERKHKTENQKPNVFQFVVAEILKEFFRTIHIKCWILSYQIRTLFPNWMTKEGKKGKSVLRALKYKMEEINRILGFKEILMIAADGWAGTSGRGNNGLSKIPIS